MARFKSFDGLEIAYSDEGAGEPILLLHGFAANADINWRAPGVIDALVASGRRVIASDARGHGQSARPHDAAAYEDDAMAKDAIALLDHLGIDAVAVAGYSMGALVTLRLLVRESRVRCAVLGGIGAPNALPGERRQTIADALEAADASAAPAYAQAFRKFADSTGADLRALAAIQRATNTQSRVDLGAIEVPCLVLVGDRDDLARDPEQLADKLPHARVELVKGTHLSAVNDPRFTEAIVEFVDSQYAKPG